MSRTDRLLRRLWIGTGWPWLGDWLAVRRHQKYVRAVKENSE